MAAKPPREATFLIAPGFKQQFRSFKTEFPEIAGPIKTFNEYKRAIPPIPLPASMRDHKLDFVLKGIMECHLSGDVLLLYEHKDDMVKMLYICRHKDLYGKRGRRLAGKLNELLAELETKY